MRHSYLATTTRRFLLALLLVAASLVVLAPKTFAADDPAQETAPTSLKTVEDDAKKSGYRLGIATCLRDRLRNIGWNTAGISPGDLGGSKPFADDVIMDTAAVNVGSLIRPTGDDNTGKYLCSELNGKMDEVKGLYGWNSLTGGFCGTGAIRRQDNSDCVNSTTGSNFVQNNSAQDAFNKALTSLNGGKGYLSPQLYLTAYNELLGSGCKMRDPVLDANANADVKNSKYKVSVVNSQGGINTVWYTVNLTKNVGIGSYFAYAYVQQEDGSNTNLNCLELITEMDKHAGDYGRVVATAATNDKTTNDTGGNGAGNGGTDAKPTCAIPNVGWIVCPVTNFLADIADGAKNILDGFLLVPSAKIFDTSSTSGASAYAYWVQMRNYANILFAVVFLIIIFSQVTSIGITNYGIKKLLPKLIITAILVNLSFYACAIMVDLSNILGNSLSQFLTNGVNIGATDTGLKISGPFSGDNPFAYVAGMALAGGGAGLALAISIQFFLAALVGALLGIIIAGIVMVFLLAVRQGLIILLIVIAPIAFVAMLLPNTEKLYKKWFDMFKSMLLLFPIVSLLFGAGNLAKNILMVSSSDALVQTIASTLPFAMMIVSLKVMQKTLEAIDGMGGVANGMRNALTKASNPLKTLAGANDKLNRQRFQAGQGPIGLRGLGNLVNRTQAGYDAKLKAAKDQTEANAREHVRDNKSLQRYNNQSAAAVQRTENANKEIKNQGERYLQSTPGGQQLIHQEGELNEETRKLAADRRSMQLQDAQTRARFIQANAAEQTVKEEEGKRDADWKATVAGDTDLVNQAARIEGQKLRGEAAEAVTTSEVKRQVAEGELSVENGEGREIKVDDIRETKQTAEARTKAAETEIKAQDAVRAADAAPDSVLGQAQTDTLFAEMETKRAEAKLQAQDEEKIAQDGDLIKIANETHAQQNKAGEAKRVQTSNYRDAILDKTDSTVVDIAGGTIHPDAGQQRAQASARAEVSRARAEVITNARVQFETASNDKEAASIATKGKRIDGTPATAEEIEAASLHLLERGAHGDKLEVIRNIASVTAGLSDPDQRQALRSTIADAYVKSSLADLGGKDFAGQLRDPSVTPDFDDKVRSSLGTLKPEAMAKDLKYAKTVLELYTKGDAAQKAAMGPTLDKLITTIRGNSTLSSSADPDTRTAIDSIAAAMGSTYTGSSTWSS